MMPPALVMGKGGRTRSLERRMPMYRQDRWAVARGKIHPTHEGAILPEDIGFAFLTDSPAQAVQVIVSSLPDAVPKGQLLYQGIER